MTVAVPPSWENQGFSQEPEPPRRPTVHPLAVLALAIALAGLAGQTLSWPDAVQVFTATLSLFGSAGREDGRK
ncbi:hypothetical protein [Nocardia wallacei]|uniref:hypothetical protein n=1 Tax=Nocardia wallacei TaxID=480035 RepID=UPI002453ECD4|nr:hypothetical protein [Nocardia wallacei]